MTIPAEAPDQPVAAAEASPAPRRARPPSLKERLADLGPRVASSLILTAIALITWLTGGILFLIAWLSATLWVNMEWQRLIGEKRLTIRLVIGAIAIATAAALANAGIVSAAVLVLFVGAALIALVAADGERAWEGAGVLYAGSLVVSVIALRLSYPFGQRAIGWLFAVVWGTDVIAYFAGRLVGGPRFAPIISPSKTWSGTLCGMVGGAALGTVFLLIESQITRLETPAPIAILFVLGLVTSAVSQAGDLFESWTKRRFGAKDSGGLIPGHGGLMDRLDGFIAAAAFVAILGALRGFPSPAEGLLHWM
ncbi:MAG TPA: phosphatidate cytidylyltransferase [Methylovirgula sp.]|jgi:phosphatidate cytidylyltransferase